MSKYDVMTGFLKAQLTGRVAVTFAEVEEALGFALPASAYTHPAWWSNDPTGHSQARAWLDAGFETEQVDVPGRRLVFRRLTQPSHAGMEEEGRMFKHAEPKAPFKKVDRHPAAGAMKGTFTIEPGYDLTRPALDDDELAEWEANLERKADLIQRGLTGKR